MDAVSISSGVWPIWKFATAQAWMRIASCVGISFSVVSCTCTAPSERVSTRWRSGITKVPLPETERILPAPETIMSLSGGHLRQQLSNTSTTAMMPTAAGSRLKIKDSKSIIGFPSLQGRLG